MAFAAGVQQMPSRDVLLTVEDVAQRLASDGYVVVSGLMSEGEVAVALFPRVT